MSVKGTTRTDTILHIYSSSIKGPAVGVTSAYGDIEHPGTNKQVEGWKWDQRTWPSFDELRAVAYAPSIWDPRKFFLLKSRFQSGVGDNKDLLLFQVEQVQLENKELWLPRIQHGYFYLRDSEYYFFSDDVRAQQFRKDTITGGLPYVDLEYDPKPGIPIQVKRYRFNYFTGGYEIALNLRKVVEFSDDLDQEEFTVDYEFAPHPRVILNKKYDKVIGSSIGLVAESGEVDGLEILGQGDGLTNEWHIQYSPIDPSQPVELYTWSNELHPIQYKEIHTVSGFTLGPSKEFKIDKSLGIVTFGNYDDDVNSGSGWVPASGEYIGLYYTAGLQVEYEPDGSRDYVLARETNLNPLYNPSHIGFVQIDQGSIDIASVTLSSDLPTNSPEHVIDAGYNLGNIYAEVIGKDGKPAQGYVVNFEIIGDIGSLSSRQAITDVDGIATIEFAAPASVDELGMTTRFVQPNAPVGGQSTVTVSGFTEPDTVSGVYLYEVRFFDSVLGVPSSGETDWYNSYIAEEGIPSSGEVGTATWEKKHRLANEMVMPDIVSAGDLDTGALVVVDIVDAQAVNPHTGIRTGTVKKALTPISISNVGTDEAPVLQAIYNTVLPMPTPQNGFISYLVAANALIKIKASAVDKKTKVKIESNEITLKIRIPEEGQGTLYFDTAGELPNSGIFTQVRDITALSDSQILATQDDPLINEDYLDSRCHLGTVHAFDIESGTIGLWHLDSNLKGSVNNIDGFTIREINLLDSNEKTGTDGEGTTDSFVSGGGATISSSTDAFANWPFQGVRSLKLTQPQTGHYAETSNWGDLQEISPSTQYTASIWARYPATRTFQIAIITDKGTIATQDFVGGGATPVRLVVTGTTQANANVAKVRVTSQSNFGGGEDAYFDGWQLERNSVATDWVDGSTQAGIIYNAHELTFVDTPVNSGLFFPHYRDAQTPVLVDSGMYQYFNWDRGTMEYWFKNTNGIHIPIGGGEALFQVFYSGEVEVAEDGITDSMGIVLFRTGSTTYRFSTVISSSGEVAFHNTGPTFTSASMLDGDWHHLKLTWDTEPIDPTSGFVTVNLYIDDKLINAAPNLVVSKHTILNEPKTFAGFMTGGFSGFYDEVRWSNEPYDFATGPLAGSSFEQYVDWFKRTRVGDSETLGIINTTTSEAYPITIPVGFRLKTPNTKLATAMGQMTYLDLNDTIPEGYFDNRECDD